MEVKTQTYWFGLTPSEIFKIVSDINNDLGLNSADYELDVLLGVHFDSGILHFTFAGCDIMIYTHDIFQGNISNGYNYDPNLGYYKSLELSLRNCIKEQVNKHNKLIARL